MAMVVCAALGLFRMVASMYRPFSVKTLGNAGEYFSLGRCVEKKFCIDSSDADDAENADY